MQNAVFIGQKKSTLHYKVLKYFLKCTAFVGSGRLLNISFVAFLYLFRGIVMYYDHSIFDVPIFTELCPIAIEFCHNSHASFNKRTNSFEYLFGFVEFTLTISGMIS